MPTGLLPSTQSPAPLVERRQHLDFLDGMRGVAALYVVLHHAWLQTWPELNYRAGQDQLGRIWAFSGWLLYGHFSVTFFITLSGFCLMMPVLRGGSVFGGYSGFLWARARRILPPYYAALSLALAIDLLVLHPSPGPGDNSPFPITRFGLLSHLLLVHDLYPSVRSKIDQPLWSVATECHIYLLFPLLVWIWKHRGLIVMLGAAGVLSATLMVAARRMGDTSLNTHYVLVFAAGMAAAAYAFPANGIPTKVIRFKSSLVTFKIAGVVATVVFVLSVHRFRLYYLRPNDLLMAFASACLLIVATRDPQNLFRRFAGTAPVVWVGGFSYSLYLIHYPLQQVVLQLLIEPAQWSKPASFFVLAVAGTSLICLVSFVLYRLVEKPFMRSRPRA